MASRFAAFAAIHLDLDLDLDLHSRSAEWARDGSGGTDVRWIPGVLSIARTQENGESTFHPAGLFHPSTIYITEKRWMSK